ncbi:geranylgeranyl transferase type II beta subunit, putative [Eimeria mitis]|uniref:Geranylgeranyl transferase type II subunit beta n=1 Tax=Eimeria mitis TaxID=44415 RepID=U6K1B0_9EIME|nr:geranylgeranyl transferase type II beta subunit, putative [Eimeria mitis]CDJ30771.1 geranylgeranyl transferase type II beta subunit, putative [Eimeria mitis]
MEGQGGGEDAVAADAPEVWCLDVTAHRLYIRQQLQRGLKMFCSTSLAEEASSASSGGSLAEALHVPFMEVQQQQHSLLSGVYWTLCCLALLQPPAVASPSSQEEQQPGTDFLPLPLKVKEDLISRVILPCLRRRQCTGWVSAAPQVEAEISLTERGSGYPRRKRVDESSQKPAMLPPATTASAAAESRAHCDLSALGFSSNLTENATATALSTCSGLQALALLEALPVLSEEDLQQLRRFVLRLQRREDGAFANTLHPECRTSWCRTCSQPLAGASPPTATTAEAKGEVKWENEGDVRCTFCCLLSLKLIHAAAKAHQKRSAASHLLQTCAVTARAVGSVGGEAPVAVTPGAPFPGEPEVCRELPADPGPRLVQPPEDPIYATSWETFLQDPLAGVRVDATFSWLLSLLGPDGGVGVSPGAEPHAGAAFCFAGCLSLLGKRDALGTEKARRLERQVKLLPTLSRRCGRRSSCS